MKNIYEFINPSDCITFYADSDEYARAVTLLLGEGKAGCKKKDGTQLDYCFTAFGNPAPQEVYDSIKIMLKEKDMKLIDALKSCACVSFDEREIFDDYTNNGTDEEKWQKWDEKHRSSLNDFCGWARKFANILQADKENEKAEQKQ